MAKMTVKLKEGASADEVSKRIREVARGDLYFRSVIHDKYDMKSKTNIEFSDDFRAMQGIIEQNVAGVERVDYEGTFRY